MKAIVESRGGGKTSRMIFEVLQNPERVIVVHSHDERQRITAMHPSLKGRVFTFDDVVPGYPFRFGKSRNAEVYIDNADVFLQLYFGNVTTISFSSDEKKEG